MVWGTPFWLAQFKVTKKITPMLFVLIINLLKKTKTPAIARVMYR